MSESGDGGRSEGEGPGCRDGSGEIEGECDVWSQRERDIGS